MTNKGLKYRDRHNDERRVVYWPKRHLDKLTRVVKKASK